MNQKASPQLLTRLAMLIALEIVLSRFLSFSTESVRIGFGFVPMALAGILFGPLWAALAYAISDILGAVLFSYGFYPGITLSALLTGMVYGLFLHRENVRFFPHIVPAVAINCIFISLGMTSFWLAYAQGMPYLAKVVTRIPQCAVMIVVQIAIIPLLVKLAQKLKKSGTV